MGQETGEIRLVVERAGIRYMVSRLQVGTEDKLTTLAQGFLHVHAKGFHELVFVIENSQVVFTSQLFFAAQGTGRKNAGYRYLVEIGLDKATFTVRLLVSKAVHNGYREVAAMNSATARLGQLGIDAVRA